MYTNKPRDRRPLNTDDVCAGLEAIGYRRVKNITHPYFDSVRKYATSRLYVLVTDIILNLTIVDTHPKRSFSFSPPWEIEWYE